MPIEQRQGLGGPVNVLQWTGNNGSWQGPELIRCTERGSTLVPVPKGLEVFGPTVMAVRDANGKLVPVERGDWVVWRGEFANASVVPDGMLDTLLPTKVEPVCVLPVPGSAEATAAIDAVLEEYGWPANPANAARAGFEAARRMLASKS